MRIVLVENSGSQGATARMLEAASQRELGTAPEVYTGAKFRQIIETFNAGDTTIFVPVSEQVLSLRRNAIDAKRVACESLQLAQMVARQDVHRKVILVARPGDSNITGVDAAAALLGGMAGIVDDRLLLSDGVLTALINHRHTDNRWRTMLALGETAARLRNIKDMFEEWDEDDSSDGTQDSACFKACMALAQLERLRPLRGPGYKYSFVKLAEALNLAEHETSFHLFAGDLRKVLSTIANRLIDPDDDSSERIRLPSIVKERLEFPSNRPVVEGISDKEIAQALYDACRSMTIRGHSRIGDFESCLARLPIRDLCHLNTTSVT